MISFLWYFIASFVLLSADVPLTAHLLTRCV